MMTVFILVLVMTCLSSLLFMVAKATCLGDIFHEVAGKKISTRHLGYWWGVKVATMQVKFNFLLLEINAEFPTT